MTGSSAAHIVIPIVALVTLAIWIAMVYYADSHPRYKASERERTGGSAQADPRQHLPPRDVPPAEAPEENRTTTAHTSTPRP